MQPLAVVQSLDKGSNGASGLAQIAIGACVFLFLLLGFREGFGLGVVLGIGDAGSYWGRFP
jgi:hypothetical protein